MSPDAYALNEETKKLLVERNKLRQAIKEILEEIPADPKLPLVHKIKEIAQRSLRRP